MPFTGNASSTSQGSQLRFAPLRAGLFRLCWCSNMLTCDFEEDFRVDFGQLYLRGPVPLQQHRTCISGHRCMVERFEGLEMENLAAHLMVLDTCSATGLTTSGLPVSSWPVSTTVQSLAATPLLVPAGLYSLCWCAESDGANQTRSCQNLRHFDTRIGQLSVLGPIPLRQDFTCILV